jgi:hypothetical protein
MRKIVVFLFILYFTNSFSQDNFRIKSIEYGVGTYKISNRNSVFVIHSSFDITAAYKSHLLSLSNNIGLGFGKNENSNTDFEGFYEVDLLYGREFMLSDKIRLETHTGLGFITQNNSTVSDEKQSLAIPIKLKLLYCVGRNFALGLNPNVSLNKTNAIYSLNFVFHINF